MPWKPFDVIKDSTSVSEVGLNCQNVYNPTREGFFKKKRFHFFKTVLYTNILNTYIFSIK